MRDDQIRHALALTLQDGELTREERDQIRDWLREPGPGAAADQRRSLCQSIAFDIANEAIEAKTLPHFTALNWLEKVIKALSKLDPAPPTRTEICEALFSPQHNCAGRVAELFGNARSFVDICVFTITDDRITDAIVRAHRRGVKIRIVTDNDKSFDPGSDIERLRALGIPVRMDRTIDHMHHKFAIFDGSLLLSGSYNWTRSAQDNNEENILLTTEKRLVVPFRDLFEKLWSGYAPLTIQ